MQTCKQVEFRSAAFLLIFGNRKKIVGNTQVPFTESMYKCRFSLFFCFSFELQWVSHSHISRSVTRVLGFDTQALWPLNAQTLPLERDLNVT